MQLYNILPAVCWAAWSDTWMWPRAAVVVAPAALPPPVPIRHALILYTYNPRCLITGNIVQSIVSKRR